ncbi:MAG: energy transducer TonB, partial [Armatimonadetes bacterium]|nr:energy transducer TonB [Armatimonadota bacterium]
GQGKGGVGAGESQGGLSRPQGMSLARPDYPEESRVRGEEGTVTLRVLVDTDGEVARVKVAESSGFQQLDRAAARGARRWRFEAARRGDVAIESWVEIGVVFRLEDATS